MGWAKYQEDIVSRWVNDNHYRRGQSQVTKSPVPDGGEDARALVASKQEKKMSNLKEFTMQSARPLPVIVLADVSGSMSADGKIEVLNNAVAEMIATFTEEDDSRAEIHVAVITFGRNRAELHKPLGPASTTEWESMSASGRTPMGEAFALVRTMIEDRDMIPNRAYRPTLILVSDGMSTDDWRGPLEQLLRSERAAKAARFAMGIGADADRETLSAFLANAEGRVFDAHEAREIKKFFRWVTMSVTARSRSTNPNSVIMVEPTDLDDIDFL